MHAETGSSTKCLNCLLHDRWPDHVHIRMCWAGGNLLGSLGVAIRTSTHDSDAARGTLLSRRVTLVTITTVL